MQKILADVLHTIGQAMLTPCLIVLALLMIAALWQIGDVLVEWFKVRRTHKLKVTELIKAIHNSAETDGNAAIRETVETSGLLGRQKNAIYRCTGRTGAFSSQRDCDSNLPKSSRIRRGLL